MMMPLFQASPGARRSQVSPAPMLVTLLHSTGHLAPCGGIVPGRWRCHLAPGVQGGWERAGGRGASFSVGSRVLSRPPVTLAARELSALCCESCVTLPTGPRPPGSSPSPSVMVPSALPPRWAEQAPWDPWHGRGLSPGDTAKVTHLTFRHSLQATGVCRTDAISRVPDS